MPESTKRAKRQRKQLTDDNVLELKLKRRQYMVWDTGVKGLHVLVNPGGARTFRSLYYIGGKPKARKLGRVGVMSVAEARKMALKDQRLAAKGLVPSREDRADSDLFEDVVNEYVDREQIARRRNVTAEEVRRVLLRDCAQFKERPIGTIRSDEIEELLEAIRDGTAEQRSRPYLANKAWGHLSTMFKWCVKKRKMAASPMALIDRPWEGAKPRDRVYTDDEIKLLWSCKLEPLESAFLKLLIITGKRKGALVSMRWGEISNDWIWTPSPGAKNKKRYPIPLPSLAQRILLGIKPKHATPDDFVFRSSLGPDRPMLVENTLQKRIRTLTGIGDFIPHACRHTCETRFAQLRVLPHLRDMLFDHAPSRGSGKDYDHYMYGDELREAMELWADFVEGLVTAQGTALLR